MKTSITCPECHSILNQATDSQLLHVCDQCGGRSVNFSILQPLLTPLTFKRLLQPRSSKKLSKKPFCSNCNEPMFEHSMTMDDQELTVDVCKACQLVWFDHGEMQQLLGENNHIHIPSHISSKLIELQKIDGVTQPNYMSFRVSREDFSFSRKSTNPKKKFGPLDYLIGLLGMPIENENRLRYTPYATWALMLTITCVSIYGLLSPRSFMDNYGFVASQPFRYYGLTIFSSFFIHGSIGHLLGNLYFLWIFGDNTEDTLGPKQYLLLLVLATLLAKLFFYFGVPDKDIPLVGASGGISALTTYYLVRFPRVRFSSLHLFVFWLTIPAYAFVGLWLLLQAVGLYQQLYGVTAVSYLSHVGGATVGLIYGLLARKKLIATRY